MDEAKVYSQADKCEQLARLAKLDAAYYANRGDEEDADKHFARAERLWEKAMKLRAQADGTL